MGYFDPSGYMCYKGINDFNNESKNTIGSRTDYLKNKLGDKKINDYNTFRKQNSTSLNAYNKMKQGINPKYDPDFIAELYERNVSNEMQLIHAPSKQNSTILSDELDAVGISKPQYPTQAHHIIPAKQAREAIAKLESLGILKNSSANGVRLPALEIVGNPQSVHSVQYSGKMYHGPEYIEYVTEGIRNCSTYDEAIGFLEDTRRGLLEGSINLYI